VNPSVKKRRRVQHTWRTPPVVLGVMPEGERDFTGRRVGQMTALYWYSPGRGGNPTVCIARCDCGSYETRIPERWHEFIPVFPGSDDACSVCIDSRISQRRVSCDRTGRRKKRVEAWFASMLQRGLSHDEVVAVMRSGIDSASLSADELRSELSKRGA
jgi:hypothetical protein